MVVTWVNVIGAHMDVLCPLLNSTLRRTTVDNRKSNVVSNGKPSKRQVRHLPEGAPHAAQQLTDPPPGL